MQNRNIKLFYLLEAILSLSGGIILPVYVCYFRFFDITLFQVALLAVVFEATIILFEFPTGLFADKFGRKFSTSIGFFLMAVAGSIFFSFRTFYGFLAAEIIFGIAETFISGALEALTVDSIDRENGQRPLAKLFANRTVFKTSALLTGMLFGGLLAEYYLPYLFYPMVLLSVTGLTFTFLLLEAKTEKSSQSALNESKKPDNRLWKVIFSNRAILALFAVGLMANFAFEPADQFWQVMFSEQKQLPLISFGFLTAAGLVVVAAVAKFTEKLYKYLTIYITGCFILAGLSLYIVATLTVYPAVAGIVVYFIVKELIRPAISTHLNQQFNLDNRAIYLSTYNLTCSVGEVAAGLVAGWLASGYGLNFIFYFAAATALLVPLIYLVINGSRPTRI